MADRSEQYPFLRELFPAAGPELLRLLEGGVDNAMLLRNDFYTMHDWPRLPMMPIGAAARDLAADAGALEEGSLCIEASPAALERRLLDLVPEPDASAWSGASWTPSIGTVSPG